MAKSKEVNFASLFPKSIANWDEAKARSKYGSADIIRFFIDGENDKFLDGFSKVKKIDSSKIDGNFIKDSFLDTANYCRPVWEAWDFSSLVVHKMRHNPPSIYEAFDYYGHKQYTLLGFGIDANSSGNSASETVKNGNKLLNETVKDRFPEVNKYGLDDLTLLFGLLQETLESVPEGNSLYEPTDLELFLKQLKSRLSNLYRKKTEATDTGAYSASNRKTINNHLLKIKKIAQDAKRRQEIENAALSGTYREKINLLHRLTADPEIRENYSQRELDIVHGLFLRQNMVVSLDNMPVGDLDDRTVTGYNIIKDNQYMNPVDRFIWTSYFTDVFKNEFSKETMENFLECLPGHFAQYPFDVDSQGALKISKYSKNILFAAFCSVLGIDPDNELRKPFLVLIQKVIDNINDSR